MTRIATLGLKSKTGKAIAVVLTEPQDSPQFLRRDLLTLADPDDAATGQPHHEVMYLSWDQAMKAVQPLVRSIERIAFKAIEALVEEVRSEGYDVRTAGIVGAPDRKLEKIGNPHIRAHAAEGVLFRHVLEVAASKAGLKVVIFSERELQINKRVNAFGPLAGPPWRAEEKAAATAAWLTLVSS